MKVLVTEATRNASNAIIRALHQERHQVIGSDFRRLAFNAHSRYSAAYYPSAGLHDANYVDSLLQVIADAKPDVLLPGNQQEPFTRERARFEQHTRLLVPTYEAWQAAYYNDRTLASCQQLGIACPRLFSAGEGRSYLRQDPRNKLMIKPRADIGGGQGLQLIHHEAQLMTALETLDLERHFLQEFIPGPVSNMRSAAVLYDQRSQMRLFFTSHKLRQWPQDGGICALGRATYEPELVDFAQPFFEHWQWQGVAEVEIKIDERDGKPRLIEINPRFWGHTNFAVQAGTNFPAAMVDLALGKQVVQPNYQTDFNYINWSCYLRCVGADLIQGADRRGALQDFLQNLSRPRARNIDWSDWRFTLAKTALELRDSAR